MLPAWTIIPQKTIWSSAGSAIQDQPRKSRNHQRKSRRQEKKRDVSERRSIPGSGCSCEASAPGGCQKHRDAFVRESQPTSVCVCEDIFDYRYHTKFQRKSKERNAKTGMRWWRFCAYRFVLGKEPLYQQRIPIFLIRLFQLKIAAAEGNSSDFGKI